MNWYKLKKKWILAKKLFFFGFGFWLGETILFLIIYGWHWLPASKAEMVCDNIVGGIWAVAGVLFSIVVINLINYLLSDIEQP